MSAPNQSQPSGDQPPFQTGAVERKQAPSPAGSFRPAWVTKTQRLLTVALLIAGLFHLVGRSKRGEFPDTSEIRPELLQDPVQAETAREAFSFSYRDETYLVDPVFDYELWGLVVTHNDITALGDIYHDDDSVDTKDLCVIWGPNLVTNDFHDIEFWSGSFTCYVRWYDNGIRFYGTALSNNHLITGNEDLRDRISGVRVGDQIHLRGNLVNYSTASHPDFVRTTSVTRDDIEGGACEVVYVESLDVLKRGTPGWYAMAGISFWALILFALSKAGIFLWEIRKSQERGRRV